MIENVKREPDSTAAGRLALALEMADFGIALMRQNLRRRFPSADEAEICRRFADWLAGPDPADVHLRTVPWPR